MSLPESYSICQRTQQSESCMYFFSLARIRPECLRLMYAFMKSSLIFLAWRAGLKTGLSQLFVRHHEGMANVNDQSSGEANHASHSATQVRQSSSPLILNDATSPHVGDVHSHDAGTSIADTVENDSIYVRFSSVDDTILIDGGRTE